MKPINEMTDQELAEAVAVEVLGWSWIDRPSSEFGGYWRKGGDGCRSYRRGAKQCIRSEIYHADGREAIENEIERRGWEMGFWIECFKSGPAYTCRITLAPTHSVHVTRTKSRYRAIAEAALMAVREEGSHGKD